MTIKTDLSVAPYYDDYKESKNFHQILFRPSKGVQVRELNQLQTILRNQINRFGDSIYKEGAVVVPGGFKATHQEISLGIELIGDISAALLTSYTKLYARSTTSNRRMLVAGVFDGDENHQAFAMGTLTYAGNSDAFTVGETLSFETVDENGLTTTIGGATIGSVGKGTIATIARGVMYVRGLFVLINNQQIVLSAYERFKDGVVGLTVDEDIITANEDDSLYSNAQGVKNEKAEGANRLVIDLTLSVFTTDTIPDNFIQLSKFANGVESVAVSQSIYSLLEDSLAQRTYEESGDYTVDRYKVTMLDYNSIYPSQPDDTKMVARLSSGRSYVRGHRIQNSGNVLLNVDKARDTDVSESVVVGINYGYYVSLTSNYGIPEFDASDRVSFYDSADTKVADAIIVGFKSSRLYLVDIKPVTGKRLLDAVKCIQLDGSTTVFAGYMNNGSLNGADQKSLLFALPNSGARTMTPDEAETSLYRVSKSFAVSLTNGVGSVASGADNLLFDPDSASFMVGTRGSDTSGEYYDATFVRGGNPVGTTLNVTTSDNTLNGTFYLLAKMIQRGSSPKSKTERTITETVVMSGSDTVSLGHTDIQSLEIVTESGNDVTSEFKLDGGQRDNRYELGYITSSQGVQSSRTLQVTYTYFAHSSGDYFNVDSYSSLDRDRVVNYTDESSNVWDLRDTLDFRPDVDGSSVTNFVYPDSTFSADVEYYLPRVDSLVVSYENGYQIIKGISSQTPTRPTVPNNAMRLYDLHIPAYTYSINDVILGEDNRQRYTMKDIANLESRISSLEYYTSLSTLENSAYNVQAVDPVTGQNRFKNGIFADPMVDFRLMDYDQSDMSLDTTTQEGGMWPRVIRNGIDFEMASGGTVDNNMVLPNYTEIEDTVQPYATNTVNLNPYARYLWLGTLSLNPASYFWVENQYLDTIYVNQTEGSPDDITTGSFTKRIANVWITKHYRYNLYETTTVTLKTWTETTASDVVVESEVIPYIKAIDVAFTVSGMRPSTSLNVYFAGINVNEFVQPNGGVTGDQLTTDSTGYASGVFHLPSTDENKFEIGDSGFAITDANTAVVDGDDDYSTYASTVFSTGGTLNIRQVTETTTRYYGANTTTRQFREYYDPVAQSFVVGGQGGSFISSIDLFFSTKSDSIPVRVELREMENGVPTNNIIATAYVLADDVNVSDDCTVATNFKFPYPVFLESDTMYAFVAASDSNAYEMGYCELGETILGGTFAVSKQPNIGVMFTSSNNDTWTASQTSDVKFTMYRCSFGEGTTTITFAPKSGSELVALGSNPISGVSGETEITIHQEAHGVVAGDVVTIADSIAGLGIEAADINGERTVSEVVDFDNFKVTVDTALTETGIIYQPTNTPVQLKSLYNFVRTYINADILENDAVALSWEYRYRQSDGLTVWKDITLLDYVMLSTRGYFSDIADFQLRATMTHTDNIAPQIDTESFTALVSNFYMDDDQTSPKFQYVTDAMYFSNPCTNVQMYLGVTLPGSSTMKAYIKLLDDESSDWVEVQPNESIVNSSSVQEYSFTYDLIETTETFSGLRVKFEFYGDGTDAVTVSNLRGVVFA